LSDIQIKKEVEEKLDREGWAWRALQGIVMELIGERVLQKKTGTEEMTRKRKKRRVIPVVWPGEGAEGWDYS